MDKKSKKVEYDREKLDLIRIDLLRVLHREFPNLQTRVNVLKTFEDRIIFDIRAYLYGQQKVIKFPVNWWQCFKEEMMPKWFNRIFPIKYYHYNFVAVFPNLAVKLDEPVSFIYFRNDK